MTNTYRILISNNDGNRKVRELNSKNGGNMRRENADTAVLTCFMIGSSWLVVVNTAVNLFARKAWNFTGVLSNCQRLKDPAACI
jgi:hypothetical protein